MRSFFVTIGIALISIGLQACGGGGGTAAATPDPVTQTAAQGIASAGSVSVVTAK